MFYFPNGYVEMNLYYVENQSRLTCNSPRLSLVAVTDCSAVEELTPVCQTLMQGHMGRGLISTVRMLGSTQIEMSSHSPFVWMVLHFYHSHMEPVWPNGSRSGCMPPVNSQPLSYLPQKLRLYVSHRGHTTTRVLPRSSSSLQHSFLFCFCTSASHQTTVCAWFFADLCSIRSPFKFCKWLVA